MKSRKRTDRDCANIDFDNNALGNEFKRNAESESNKRYCSESIKRMLTAIKDQAAFDAIPPLDLNTVSLTLNPIETLKLTRVDPCEELTQSLIHLSHNENTQPANASMSYEYKSGEYKSEFKEANIQQSTNKKYHTEQVDMQQIVSMQTDDALETGRSAPTHENMQVPESSQTMGTLQSDDTLSVTQPYIQQPLHRIQTDLLNHSLFNTANASQSITSPAASLPSNEMNHNLTEYSTDNFITGPGKIIN